MMVTDGWCNTISVIQFSDHGIGNDAVLFHNSIFFFTQLAGFADDLIRDTDLSNIMQFGCPLDIKIVLCYPIAQFIHFGGNIRNSFGMTIGIFVF